MTETVNYISGKKPLFHYVQDYAIKTPEKVAFVFYGREIAWKELDELANRFANFLIAKGVKKGDSVAVYVPNCPQYILAYIGANKIGAAIVSLNPTYKEFELEYMLKQVEAETIVTLDHQYPVIANIKDKTKLKNVVVTSFADFLPPEPTIPFGLPAKSEIEDFGNSYFLCDILEQYDADPVAVDVDIDDTYLYIFTSGTTGMPKGAMLSYRNAIYKSASTSQSMFFPIEESDVNLISLPIMHIAGLLGLNASIYLGITSVLLVRFDPVETLTAIEKYKCTHWVTITLAIKYLLGFPGIDNLSLKSLKKTLVSSLAMVLTEQIADSWSKLTESIVCEASYGLTEDHTGDTYMPTDKIKFGKICCGLPIPENKIKIIDYETKKEAAQGEPGEIVVKNEGVFKGYWKNPEATNEVLRDGWLFTGDIGKLDEDGYLWFLGRKKEMIKSSGFSVFPEEVEGILLNHPAVAEIGVIGIPDDEIGEAVKAVIVLTGEQKETIRGEDIINWAKDKMAGYKRPKFIEFRDELPKGGTGKVLRRILLEEELKNQGKN
ncbi:MAG: AMP-binding protein [Dethiobacter sp.]|jgi:long-chain acyl-CoA synthetase|nr:AMP-binding protein [Dethiobacter sp.]